MIPNASQRDFRVEMLGIVFLENIFASVSNNATNNANTIVNNYYNTQVPEMRTQRVQYLKMAPPRPKINIGLAILLCWLYIFPGLIYIGSVKNKQREWDEKYGDID